MHHRWFRNQFSPFFPVLHCPLGPAKLQACPFPDVVFPPLPLSALCSSTFYFALPDAFGGTWWMEDMTMPLQFVSLYYHQEIFVWFSCLLDLGVDFLVGNMVIVWDAHYLVVAPNFHDSQAYRKMDVTRERISCILELREMFLSFQTGFNLVNAAVICAVPENISGLEPSSIISEPRYLYLYLGLPQSLQVRQAVCCYN